MTPTIRRAYLELHFAVLLYGFTAVLGGLIQLPAVVLVWWRVTIALSAMFIYGDIPKRLVSISRQDRVRLFGVGIIVALHWLDRKSVV